MALGLAAGLAVAGPLLAQDDPLGAGGGAIFRLQPVSAFEQGCFPPCLCPILYRDQLRGTMKLVHTGSDGAVDTYQVRDVYWRISGDISPLRVVGGGQYRIGTPHPALVIEHRMELDLQINNEAVQHFDSGWVPVEQFGGIHIAVSMNGMFCFDTVFYIHALRVPDAEIIPYALRPGSTFQRGCWDPCDCPLGEELPMAGTFGLVALAPDASFNDYAVVDVDWHVLMSNAGVSTPIRGFGAYQVAPDLQRQRMSLALEIGQEPRAHFDSGDAAAGAIFPDIDVVVSEHGMVCFDTALHVVAGPQGQVCGGIAGIPCEDPNEFCKLPEGHCCCDFFGICTPIPQACPTVWDPVCGCDGMTYGNECEADAASVSIDHRGPCDGEGACCTDIGGIPLPVPVCTGATQENCEAAGGFFEGPGTICREAEACCPTSPNGECVDREPFCCVSFGGVPLGPGTSCGDVSIPVECGQICGGIAGIPCEEPDTFCKLPEGHCCCDFFGVCTPIPQGCPDVWDPVCGCDGTTYGNECEADAAGVSIDHRGPCGPVCCNPNDRPPSFEPVWCCQDGSWLPDDGDGMPDCPLGPACCGGPFGEQCYPQQGPQFCKYPEGVCGSAADGGGLCTPIPQACPEIYDPVCGCDGVTYSNECFADAAAVSVLHHGPCGPPCPAVRTLDGPNGTPCAGAALNVQIVLSPPAGAAAIAVEDSPPAGWSVANISDGGTFDAVNGKVKWGPFFPPFPPELSYDAAPTANQDDGACFDGLISIDGVNETICGDSCVDPCCPFMAADLPQPECGECPSAGCDACNAGVCRDHRIALCELIGYACQWHRGCHDDISGMTRAAFIWRNGECYCWDDGGANWIPAGCPAPGTGCCGGRIALEAPMYGAGLNRAEDIGARINPFDPLSQPSISGATQNVSVKVIPPPGTSAVALEVVVPKGWTVESVHQGGAWDERHRKVKWGPLFGDGIQRLSFEVRAAVPAAKTIRDSAREPKRAVFKGTVSFDGLNRPLKADQSD
jgi:hypothetical protein